MLEGRREEDVFPTYYRANSRERLAALARSTGFEIVDTIPSISTPEFFLVPPLLLVELLWLRLALRTHLRERLPQIVAILRKHGDTETV